MCNVDKIIASLVLFFEEKDTSFLCEKCLCFLNAQRKEFLTFGCFLFAFPMFFFRVVYIYYIYTSLTCERLFFNFGSDTETLFVVSHRELLLPNFLRAKSNRSEYCVTALDDDDVLATR